MKIVVISDIHANLAAIKALPEEEYDLLWCLGDLVGYGPRPHETVRWANSNVDAIVRGNHDHAAGFSVTPECSPAFRNLAAATHHYTEEACTRADCEFLRGLPLRKQIMIDETKFYLVHASPMDPLFGYLPEDSEQCWSELYGVDADVLFVGHTHRPFIRQFEGCVVVAPGSIGQPKTGRPLACYAVWEDGQIELKEYEYPIEETIEEIAQMPISERDRRTLVSILRTGQFPAQRNELGISIGS